MNQPVSFVTLADRKLAYQQRFAHSEQNALPGVFFLGGLASDMTGTKASFLDARCAQAGYGFLRFDYRGHGLSSGAFTEGCIGAWADDARLVFETLTKGPQILVASSMGGWIGLLLAQKNNARIAGYVGLAAAPDFTRTLIEPALSATQRAELAERGYTYEDEALEGQRIPITRTLMEDGARQLVMDKKTRILGPVHLLQGKKDKEVPWHYAFDVADAFESEAISVTLLEDADHRLSRTQDLEALWTILDGMIRRK